MTQAYLRDKYDCIMARDRLDSAEPFIERASSRRSLSGWAYQVRCRGGVPSTSTQWLNDERARLRKY